MRRTLEVLSALSALLLSSCGGGRPTFLSPDGGGGGSISGLVIKGRVGGATVHIFRLNGTQRGTEVGSGTTADDGSFTVPVGASEGPFLIAATGGSFIDEAPGTEVNLNSDELDALIPSFSAGTQLETAMVTPVSHLATALAFYRMKSQGLDLATAISGAYADLNSHFAGVDWQKVVPTDLTASTGSQVDDPAKAGLVLAGLSQMAVTISTKSGLTPGGAVNSLTVLKALTDDVSFDGFFDGAGPGGPIDLPAGADAVNPTRLDGNSVRQAFAQGIADFLNSARNTSAIHAADAQSLLHDLSVDSNPHLFRSAGGEFDNTPPVVTLTATFHGADGSDHDPVGASKLVAGTVTVTVDATDASGVTSLTVQVGGADVPPAPQGNTVSHFVGSWSTNVDGPLTFVVTAQDKYGNVQTQSYAFEVDNTEPSLSIAAPAVGFYSDAVAVDASATDANGIASLTTSLPSFVDSDTAANHVLGIWAIPQTQGEGPLTVVLSACDAVFNCVSVPRALEVDRTAPTIALSGAAPSRYTKATSVSFSINATDSGAGVKRVLVQNGTGTQPIEGTFSSGSYSFSSIPLNPGFNELVVWAEDLAQSPNSGVTLAGPYKLSFDVSQDASAPIPNVETVAAYFDERGMTVQQSAGAPVMPAVYQYPQGAKSNVGPNLAVYKASTRMSAGASATDAAELEGNNASNTPYLQFSVNYDSSVDSPISSATYSVDVSCPGCPTFAAATGNLMAAARTGTGQLFFDLPLSTETIPALAQLTNSPATLTVNVTLTDAAGNVGSPSPITVTYNVIGAPLAWAEDTNYPNDNDPRSAFAYHLYDGTYANAFSSSNPNFSSEPLVRLVRYLIRNPAPVPVAVSLQLSSPTWQAVEEWDDSAYAYPNTTVLHDGSFTYATVYDWDTDPNNNHSACQACDTYTSGISQYGPCGIGTLNTKMPVHALGDATQFTCISLPGVPTTNAPFAAVQATPQPRAYQSPTTYGGETLAAPSTAQGDIIVPAASGSTPGAVVVYISRPLSSTRSPALVWQTMAPGETQPKYQYRYGYFWKYDRQSGCTYSNPSDPLSEPEIYVGYSWQRALSSAVEQLGGTFAIESLPLASSANASYGLAQGQGSVSAAHNFSH